MSVTSDDLKAVMRNWASGVTVVTAASGEQRAGATVSSFTSVSVDPPLVLVCLFKTIDIAGLIPQAGAFAVSLLGDDQKHISDQMAGYGDIPDGEDRFYSLSTQTQTTGSPILADALAWVDCEVEAIHDGGTHNIVVGRVVAAGVSANERPPLIYHNRAYRLLRDEGVS